MSKLIYRCCIQIHFQTVHGNFCQKSQQGYLADFPMLQNSKIHLHLTLFIWEKTEITGVIIQDRRKSNPYTHKTESRN